MKYTVPKVIVGNFGAPMKHKTQAEREEFVKEALEAAEGRWAPIVPPEHFSPRQKAVYMALHNAYRYPLPPEREDKTSPTDKETGIRPTEKQGPIARLLHLIR